MTAGWALALLLLLAVWVAAIATGFNENVTFLAVAVAACEAGYGWRDQRDKPDPGDYTPGAEQEPYL